MIVTNYLRSLPFTKSPTSIQPYSDSVQPHGTKRVVGRHEERDHNFAGSRIIRSMHMERASLTRSGSAQNISGSRGNSGRHYRRRTITVESGAI